LEKNIYILSDSQDVTEVLHSGKSVWDCHQSVILAEHNNVQLLWVPGHNRIEGNESANQVAKGAYCTHLQDLNQLVASQRVVQSAMP
jgi:ribonuclease HI